MAATVKITPEIVRIVALLQDESGPVLTEIEAWLCERADARRRQLDKEALSKRMKPREGA